MNLVEVMAYADECWALAQANPPGEKDREAIAALYENYLTTVMTQGELEIYRAEARRSSDKRIADAEAIQGAARRAAVNNAIRIAAEPIVMPPMPYRSPAHPEEVP